jgi:tRNA A37 threonylcarbamoyladenosine synthetase subunit TsaC/SUA5/YrdC
MIARNLAEILEYPVTATSANLSGQPDLYELGEITSYYGEVTPDLVIDAGQLELNPPSSIYDARGEMFIQLR